MVDVNVRSQDEPHVIEGGAKCPNSVLKSGQGARRPCIHHRESLGRLEAVDSDVAGTAEIVEIEERSA
jgi:hypothetical protein